jgi:hypothetical protein
VSAKTNIINILNLAGLQTSLSRKVDVSKIKHITIIQILEIYEFPLAKARVDYTFDELWNFAMSHPSIVNWKRFDFETKEEVLAWIKTNPKSDILVKLYMTQ